MPRKPMPPERAGITKRIKIAGDGKNGFKGYATVGCYEDGKPGEVFIVAHKAGSMERGLCHALALVISLALQRGVPMDDITDKLTGLKFEPAGVTGDTGFPMVSSVCDYLGRWMKSRWGAKE